MAINLQDNESHQLDAGGTLFPEEMKGIEGHGRILH
jgi:hypothetical protein